MPPLDSIVDDEDIHLSEEDNNLFKEALEGKTVNQDSYTPIEFEDPIEMVYTIDENFREGRRELHPWQININRFVAQDCFNYRERLRLYIAACNGSGKDAYLITLIAVFLSITKVRHRCIITSASYTQMYSQTQSYIRSLANLCNKYFSSLGVTDKMFIIKKDHIVCVHTGSEIKMFVTDDPGRAEGFHPFPDTPGSELCVIVNEAKSVADEIFTALKRCTYNRWIEVSSTGTITGHFYNRFQRATDLTDFENFIPGKGYRYRVTYKDCPHISEEAYEEDVEEFGADSNLIKSKYWSIFTSEDSAVVISQEIVDRIFTHLAPKKTLGLGRRAGVDLSANAGTGDENCLVALDDNELLAIEAFRQKNTVITVSTLIVLFEKYNLEPQNIWIDDGGVGRGIIDQLVEKGWQVNRVLNQSPAINKLLYGNRGAELWFNVQKILDRHLIRIPEKFHNDYKLRQQLATRFYKRGEAIGKIVLESKKEAKSNGHGSPDRADAFMLAFAGLTFRNFITGNDTIKKITESKYDQTAMLKTYLKSKYVNNRHERFQLQRGRPSDFLLEDSVKKIRSKNPMTLMKKFYRR